MPKKKEPPKLKLLKGGTKDGKTPTQQRGQPDEQQPVRQTPVEREEQAFELFHQAFEQLAEVERTFARAGLFTQVEAAQALGKMGGALYAGTFFDALSAIHTARARISECREATRRYGLLLAEQLEGK
jgi:hypothetical protein